MINDTHDDGLRDFLVLPFTDGSDLRQFSRQGAQLWPRRITSPEMTGQGHRQGRQDNKLGNRRRIA